MVLPLMAIKDVIILIEYLAEDEKKHFEEMGRPKNHIWHCIQRLQKRFIKI